MADTLQPGTATDAAPSTRVEIPAPTQAPQEPTPPQSPPVGTGDELATLREQLAEKERLINDTAERAARAEHEAMLTRNIVEQFSRDRKPQETVPDVPLVSDDEFLTNPGKATAKIIEGYFERDRRERERERAEQYVSTARQAYEQGKTEAVKANPNLYRGIESDLSREVFNTVQSSMRTGQPIDAGALRDPRYWEAAAVAMRIMRGEDVSKYYSRSHTPMAPVHQDTPGPSVVPQVGATLSPEEEALIAKANITREQYLAAKETERAKSAFRSGK
jgi:hypothetical protein